MQKRATVKDIAKRAGVSPATVSLVLRNSPLVARPTRERVRSSITSLGYVYDRAAANLRARLTQTVGLIVCEITNPFYAELTAGIDEALDRAGWVAFLANTAESPLRQDRFIERMREHRVDGLLLSPAEGTDPEIIERLHRLGLPVVQVLRRLGRRVSDHVGADFRLGMTLAAEHLIRLGHRRLAFVGGGRRASPARDRAHAYRETLRRHGLPIGPIIDCLPTREEGEKAVGRAAHRRAGRSDGDPLPQRRLRLRRAGRARRPRAGRRQGLRGDRFRQYPGGGALPPGPHHRRDRRAADRRGGGRAAPAPNQGARRAARKHHSPAAADHSLELRRSTRRRRSQPSRISKNDQAAGPSKEESQCRGVWEVEASWPHPP